MNWDGAPAAFDAIAFDEANREFLSAEGLGILAHEGALPWTRASAFEGVRSTAPFVIIGRRAVLGGYRSEVLVVDLDTGARARLGYPPPPGG